MPEFARTGRHAPGVAVVVGGSGGLGSAAAERLAADGHHVVVTGRRLDALDTVVARITDAGGRAEARVLDTADPAAVREVFSAIADEVGTVTTLVLSAGTNTPQRWWSTLTDEDFTRIVDTNLSSVTRCILRVLPGMREAGFGQIIVISSWAGFRYMSVAGAAYGSSKTGLSFLVESLNDQEGRSGIRSTLLCPGEVDTPILKTRNPPPPQEEIDRMLVPENVAEAVGWITALPSGVCVNELVLTPTWNRIYVADSAYPPKAV
ncbi:SDR family oxidoreductase [Microbacterium sp. NPDC089696]|uniref:SDR family oxidoreductase n=1 Tax=Microbacterium sp. NPDC089696 TaxID=3364199 RepID=UPI003830E0EC